MSIRGGEILIGFILCSFFLSLPAACAGSKSIGYTVGAYPSRSSHLGVKEAIILTFQIFNIILQMLPAFPPPSFAAFYFK